MSPHGEFRREVPPQPSASKFDLRYPANGDSEVAALYLREIYLGQDVQPKIDDFKKVPIAQREADKRKERELELEFRRRSMGGEGGGTEEGGVLEQFLIKEMSRNDWFGGETFRTTKFDDYHGIDTVLEWDEADRFGRYPRLLVDYTTSQLPERVAQKQQKLIRGGNVVYYRSPFEMDDEGEERELSLHSLPVVILGIDKGLMPKIAGMAKAHEKPRTMQNGRMVRNISPQTFRDHPLQVLLLEQAIAQVDVQVRAAAGQLVNLERTIGNRDAANTLDALRFRLGNGRMTPEVIMKMLTEIEPALRMYQESNKGNMAVMSNVIAVSRWENLAAVYQMLTEKMAEVQANKNADQLMAARAWKQISPTHKLLTKVAA